MRHAFVLQKLTHLQVQAITSVAVYWRMDIEKGLFNAGDKIIVAGYRGNEVTSNGVKYLLINAKDVEAKVYE